MINLRNKKILITGSAGFIGSALKRSLIESGARVKDFDIRLNKLDNVCNLKRMQRAVKIFKPEGIIHLAAMSRVEDGFKDPHGCVQSNIVGTTNVLEAARLAGDQKKPWIILASSREVFGEPKKLPATEKTPRQPINVYGVAKLTDELLAENYADNYGLKAWVLRFSNVYTGLNDRPERVIPIFIRRALANQPLIINGGKQVFAFTHISDVVRGIGLTIKTISKSQQLYEDINLGGEKLSIIKLAKAIINLSGSQSQIVFNAARRYDVNVFWIKPLKAKKILGWTAQMSIGQGLKKSIKEFKD